MDVLREIIPVYDKVNSYISLGRDATHRDTGIRGRINPGDVVLAAGWAASFLAHKSVIIRETPNAKYKISTCTTLVPFSVRNAGYTASIAPKDAVQ